MPDLLNSRIEVTDPGSAELDEILTPQALEFVAKLDNMFAGRRRELLDTRRWRRGQIMSGAQTLGFLPETRSLRSDESWQVAPPAPGLEDRRVEITGPAELSTAMAALNSGAQVWLADFADTFAPTWGNVLHGQRTLYDAIRRNIEIADTWYTTRKEPTTIVVGLRGWHLVDKHIRIDGRPVSAGLVDFGLYFFHNARQLIARGKGPYFSLPQLESHHEARLWNDVFRFAQQELGIPQGTIRATVPIETITAVFEMDEILFQLREHAAGLAVSRWNYLGSMIATFAEDPDYVLPDPAQLSITVPFLRAYTELLVRTCHKRGAHAIGETAEFASSGNKRTDAAVAETVRRDKERTAGDCFDGSSVAHPILVPVCRSVFDEVLGGWPNQLGKLREDVVITAGELLNVGIAGGVVTEQGVRTNINTVLRYFDAWLRGDGTAALSSTRASTATAEVFRCQVWHWLRHGTMLDDGTVLTRSRVQTWLTEELASLRAELGEGSRLDEAREIFAETALGEELPSFFTPGAYARYLAETS